MSEIKFHESIDLLKNYTPEEIASAKVSTLNLINSLYAERSQISDEVKRTILHYRTADKHREKRVLYIDFVSIPLQQKRVEQQLGSFYKPGKGAAIRQLKKLVREKDYLLRSRTEHTQRVKQIARRLIVVYSDIVKAEAHQKLLDSSDKVKAFLELYGMTPYSIDETNVERWSREYARAGGAAGV